ncbi:MAG: hypothetical protein H0V09_07665 [Gemmatimonadetes bacterium]|nr:hypothetical protein [Gemmatimonadota bacterium]
MAALALFVPLGLLLFDPRLFTGGDNVVYYLLGRALAEGQGYVTIFEPGNPPHALYPPGYPLLLVPVFWLFGGSLMAAKAISFGSALVALVLASRWLRERLAPEPASAAVHTGALLLTATNATFLAYSHWTLTEMPYLAASLGALLLAERDGTQLLAERDGVRWGGGVVAALLAAAGFLMRSAALPLCVAVSWAVWRNRGRGPGLAAAAITLAAVLGWAVRNALVAPEAPGYLDQLAMVDPYDPSRGTLGVATLIERVAGNATAYGLLETPRSVWPFLPPFGGSPSFVAVLLGLTLAPLLLYGAWGQVAARGLRAGEVYAVLYLGLLLVWPWHGDRFLLPLLPLGASYVARGALQAIGALRSAAAPAGPAPRAALAFAICALAILPNVAHALRLAPGQVHVTASHLRGNHFAGYDRFSRSYFGAAEWLRENSPPDALVLSRKPQFTYLFSGRKSVIYPYAAPERIEADVVARGVDYVIFDRLGGSSFVYLRPYFLRYMERYELVYTFGEPPTAVFRRRAPADPQPSGRGPR